MKLLKLLITGPLLLYFMSCSDKQTTEEIIDSEAFYVGTYTDGESQGIYKYSLHANGKLDLIGLSAKSINPSFLTKTADNKYLVAVNEINNNGFGTVESYRIREDSLQFLTRSSTGGAHPCFVTIGKQGYVLVANYTGGNVGLLKLKSDGSLSSLLDVQQHTGKGTTDRQENPHAHSAWFAPHTNEVISVDLGTNELWFSRVDTVHMQLTPSSFQKIKMNVGAGPRHLVFHPNGKWVYVINELTSSISTLSKNEEGEYKLGATVSTLPTNYSLHNQCADIHISQDGKFLYASNRGHNSIAIFRVEENQGRLDMIGIQPTGGDWPRNFALSTDDEFIIVANKKSNNLVSFKRDKSTGLLNYVDSIKASSPVCILF